MIKNILKTGLFLNILFAFVSSRVLANSFFTLEKIEEMNLEKIASELISGDVILVLLFLVLVLYVHCFPQMKNIKKE
jgi:Fe2+ transport system protein B